MSIPTVMIAMIIVTILFIFLFAMLIFFWWLFRKLSGYDKMTKEQKIKYHLDNCVKSKK